MSLFQFMKQYKAKDILQNKRLLVSNPKYFNDPFDSRVAVDDNDPEYLKISREWASCPIEIGVGFCCKNPYEKEFNYTIKHEVPYRTSLDYFKSYVFTDVLEDTLCAFKNSSREKRREILRIVKKANANNSKNT